MRDQLTPDGFANTLRAIGHDDDYDIANRACLAKHDAAQREENAALRERVARLEAAAKEAAEHAEEMAPYHKTGREGLLELAGRLRTALASDPVTQRWFVEWFDHVDHEPAVWPLPTSVRWFGGIGATRLERAGDHNRLRDLLEADGHHITYDWTHHGAVYGRGVDGIREVAKDEARGVVEADVVFVLLPGGRGTHVELGIALGLDKPVLIVSDDPATTGAVKETCAFYHHPAVAVVPRIEHAVALARRFDSARSAARSWLKDWLAECEADDGPLGEWRCLACDWQSEGLHPGACPKCHRREVEAAPAVERVRA